MTLNPQQFPQLYHGSGQDITQVRPAKEHGISSTGIDSGKGSSQVTKEHAFATTDEHDAWYFAGRSHGTWQKDETGAPVRPRVYTVDPHPEMKKGLRHADNGGGYASRYNPDKGEHIAPHYNVTGQIDIKPGHQGTIPTINWNQFNKGNFNGPWHNEDLNHPTNNQQELGHTGSRMRAHYNEVTQAHEKALRDKPPRNPKQGKLF